MPQLIIDNLPIQVPPGTKVIEAAERLGIMIPRFCYHAALGSVGACRLCAVKFLDGPVKGLQMSCMVEALDGMVVSTSDAEAVEFRRSVIEWLMLHHPHDCPVCDEGGHCLLQDHTESSGHAIRRYRGLKRTHRDQYLGPLLQHEMNRCIQCYRCSRYYQEFAGYRDLGVMQIGNKVYFGRHRDGVLQSPFAGNLADICPTGVFTDKPSRFKGRRWDYERMPSVCINCSLGCNTMVSARYREVVRQEARFNADVNGYFICDRGRHGFSYASAAERPRTFRLDGRPTDRAAALENAAQRLRSTSERYGPGAVACIGSLRSSLETQGTLVRLCRAKGWPAPVFFDDDDQLAAVQTAVAWRRADLHVSMRAMESTDAALLVGCDPINEAPMLAMALRQAQRRGAAVIAADPRAIELPLTFRHIPMTVGRTAAWLAELTRRIGDPDQAGRGKADDRDPMAQTAFALTRSLRPVIVCGTDAVDSAAVAQAGRLARGLHTSERRAGLFSVLPGPNALSAALFSESGRSITQVVERIEQGHVKALLVVETDPIWRFSDRQRLAQALKRLELLVIMDYVDGPRDRDADVFLVSTTHFESGGTYINQEGRAQTALAAFAGGTPIRLTGGGDHPPRVYGLGLPGTEPLPAWQMLSTLAEDSGLAASGSILSWLAAEIPGFGALKEAQRASIDGVLLSPAETVGTSMHLPKSGRGEMPEPPRVDELELITGEQIFGSEELSCRSPQLAELEPSPSASLSLFDAKRLNLGEGDHIAIDTGAGEIRIDVNVSDRIVPGTLFLPRHHRLDWQRLSRRRMRVPFDRIRKVT
jgi:NADH-quinone oxidoreductase subunit G